MNVLLEKFVAYNCAQNLHLTKKYTSIANTNPSINCKL